MRVSGIYFNDVINWVEKLFPVYRKEQKGIEWGFYYNKYKNKEFNSEYLEKEVKRLMLDEDVTSKKGIYEYLITKEEKYLNIRVFDKKLKREIYEKQNGECARCGNNFEIDKMEADHITPWSEGGATIKENCQMLCKNCNRRKSNK